MEDKLILALCLSALFVVVLSKLVSSAMKPRLNLPPGPWTLPLIGSLHHLVMTKSPQTHRSLRALSEKHGPIMQLWMGEVPAVVVSSPAVAEEVLKHQDLRFADRHLTATTEEVFFGGRDVIFGPYSERWRHLRKICMQELLTAARVRSFQGVREREVARLVRELAADAGAGGDAGVNLNERISKLANDIVMVSSVGGRCSHRDEFLDALEVAKKQITWLSVADLFPSSKLARMVAVAPRKGLASRKRMELVIRRIIQERKDQLMDDSAAGAGEAAAGKDCFLDVLLRLQKEGGTPVPVTDEIIVVLLFDMISGASETSPIVLIWTLAELMRNPRIMAKAQAEVRQAVAGKTTITEDDIVGLSYLKMVIKETLRLHPPAPLLNPRKCRETSQVMGYDIPKGTSVFVNMWAICRDSRYWEDPEEYEPERFENNTVDYKGNNFEFLPFGSGRRICPGINLGVANLELPLASLLYHFDWKLPNGMAPKDLDMHETSGMVAAKLITLNMCPITHIAPSSA
ncbi:ent-isokaurene C2/C3-hydroxylase [Oryza glaberrima]|uniref:ent-isokaurene C2/C3-hydroxylase n=1 Tax=Oryza glaberrima TaxID=4538 RepID=UPI00224C3CBA|nr:ent-isokaurene C2/C3-hydroxylase [Oryza glaberrima]